MAQQALEDEEGHQLAMAPMEQRSVGVEVRWDPQMEAAAALPAALQAQPVSAGPREMGGRCCCLYWLLARLAVEVGPLAPQRVGAAALRAVQLRLKGEPAAEVGLQAALAALGAAWQLCFTLNWKLSDMCWRLKFSSSAGSFSGATARKAFLDINKTRDELNFLSGFALCGSIQARSRARGFGRDVFGS